MAKDPSPTRKKAVSRTPDPTETVPLSVQADAFEGAVESSEPTAAPTNLEQTADFDLAPEDEVAHRGAVTQSLGQTEDFTMTPREEEEDALNYLLAKEDKSASRAEHEDSSDSDFDLNLAPPEDTDVGADAARPRKPAANDKRDKTQGLSASEVAEARKKVAPPAPAKAANKATPGKPGDGKSPSNGKPGESKPGDGKKKMVLGDYEIFDKLGQGGMGSVFKARQISLERDVALKVLSDELSAKPAFVQRFKREAKVMAKLDHPNILRCFEVKEVKGKHFLAMEFIDGGSVEGWLKKLGKFSLGDALCIVIHVARALDHAHDLNLVHRDIKPDNILLTKKGVIKVADLGLAKATDDDMSLTKTGTGAGTPIYMAPEQARDVKHVDGRVDIYALGIMLYVFLTGEPPFKGETLVDLIEAKEKGKYKPIRQLNEDVPERLDLIVGKMLANKPEHRYSSCAEIIEELEGLGLHEERLSFIGAAAAPGKTVSNKPLGKKGPDKQAAKSAAPAASKADILAPPAEFYYWQFNGEDGQPVTKKVKKGQVVTLIKTGSVDAQDQISKTAKGGYRSLGTYKEFQPFFKDLGVKEEADKKGEKYRDLYKQIESEEVSRRRWRWLHNLTLRAGGFVGLLLWLVVVGAVLVGGYFLVSWGLGLLGESVQKAGSL